MNTYQNRSMQEALALVEAGEGDMYVHFLYEDTEMGISSPISHEELSRGGYINIYHLVRDVANPDNWR